MVLYFLTHFIVQIIGYGARAGSHFFMHSTILYAIQSLLILLAPTLYAASIYMVLGRIISFLHGEHLSYIPVKWMTKVFVAGDILSFILQAAGKPKQLLVMNSWSFSNHCCLFLNRWWNYDKWI
jgi:hypothetical protein